MYDTISIKVSYSGELELYCDRCNGYTPLDADGVELVEFMRMARVHNVTCTPATQVKPFKPLIPFQPYR